MFLFLISEEPLWFLSYILTMAAIWKITECHLKINFCLRFLSLAISSGGKHFLLIHSQIEFWSSRLKIYSVLPSGPAAGSAIAVVVNRMDCYVRLVDGLLNILVLPDFSSDSLPFPWWRSGFQELVYVLPIRRNSNCWNSFAFVWLLTENYQSEPVARSPVC
jgi:hypothetical protein